ncbi:MAG: FHA domain-containing protein [Kiritimatiellae bacterium]|nr:FHA domain-containing protein [Kiritimatiellia bacterium]
MYRLSFLNGRLKGRRVTVQQGVLLIGRDSSCEVELSDDALVAHQHIQLETRKDGVWLRDLDTMTPAMVNGEAVTEVKLRAGDLIQVGNTQIEFQPVSMTPVSPRRRRSRLHALTVLAVGGILAIEVAFIFIFPIWHSRFMEKTAPAAPTNAPAAVASSASTPAEPSAATGTTEAVEVDPALQAEVSELKQAVSGLREQVQALSPQATSNEESVAAEPLPPQPIVLQAKPSESPPPAPVVEQKASAAQPPPMIRPEPEDPLEAKVRELMTFAQVEARKGNLLSADQALERVLMLSPDSVSGLMERARLYEKRGMLKDAGELWAQVLPLVVGTPEYDEAMAERQRLAREESARLTAAVEAELKRPPAAPLRQIRITSIDRERFQGNEEFDEMRVLHIHIRPRLDEGRVDSDSLEVRVVFFDRASGSSTAVPTDATVPTEPLRVDGDWAPGEQKTVTATYVIPRRFREEEALRTGQRRVYDGYRVQVWYKGALQDEEATPRSLLKGPMPRLAPPSTSRPAPKPVLPSAKSAPSAAPEPAHASTPSLDTPMRR